MSAIFNSVLIETYWNVNVKEMFVFRKHILVLIETYWNVNMVLGEVSDEKLIVLIETYWNVNPDERHKTRENRRSLNRNILECKSK